MARTPTLAVVAPLLLAAIASCAGGGPGASPRGVGLLPSPRPVASEAPAPPPALADPPTWESWRHADELILAPRRFDAALAPLVRHRLSQGHVVARLDLEAIFERAGRGAGDAKAVQQAVQAIAAHAPDSLRAVLLVGDFDELPTFFLRKLSYEHHTVKEHDNPHAITQAEHATYPSDDPYGSTGPARLAVGRVPARTPEEVDGFVRKLVAYEAAPLAGTDQTWRRRVTLYAGDPYFGATGDELVQTIAAGILDQDMSYDYDLRLTFAKEDSPYAYGFDVMPRKFASDMNDGAIVAAYVGHGSVTRFAPAQFRGRSYLVAGADDAAELRIAAGKPVFFSLACDTGAFDRPGGLPSLAERMILNPDGPVAVFASSRESHPYPNALYAQSIIRHFVGERPATVGAGILAVKQGMVQASMPIADLLLGDDVDALKAEHVSLYNLFGDPATTLRYAAPLTITPAAGAVAEGASVDVQVSAPTVGEGRVRVTVETHRAAMKPPAVPAADLAHLADEQALAALTKNNAVANDKVVTTAEAELHGGRARLTIDAPVRRGSYVLKAFAYGADAATGHADLVVGAP